VDAAEVAGVRWWAGRQAGAGLTVISCSLHAPGCTQAVVVSALKQNWVTDRWMVLGVVGGVLVSP